MTGKKLEGTPRRFSRKQTKVIENFGISGETLGDIVERLSIGKSFQSVAETLGYSLIGLSNLRKREGLSKRFPKEAIRLRPKFSQTTEYQERKILKINNKLIDLMGKNAIDKIKFALFNGSSIKNIAKRLNLPENTLADWLRVLKINKKSVRQEVYERAKEQQIIDSLKEWTKLVFKLYFNEGLTMVQIVKYLHDRGRQITRQGVSDLIQRNIRNLDKKLIK